jgi:hypothetical protein
MQKRRKQSWADILLVWGFVLSFAAVLVAGGFEAYKILAVIPAAFGSSSGVWRNPMAASQDDYQPVQPGRRKMTSRNRAQFEDRGEQQER